MTPSNAILEALKEALTVLDEVGVDYCLFGGLAMQAYKRIRSTMDVDLLIAIEERKTDTFISLLEKRGFKFDRKKSLVKTKDLEFLRCTYIDEISQLDIAVDFAIVKSKFQRKILRRKQELDILGLKVNVTSCEDLILLKVLSGRPLDRVDADVLLKENIMEIDKGYLKKWAKELGIERRVDYMLFHP